MASFSVRIGLISCSASAISISRGGAAASAMASLPSLAPLYNGLALACLPCSPSLYAGFPSLFAFVFYFWLVSPLLLEGVGGPTLLAGTARGR